MLVRFDSQNPEAKNISLPRTGMLVIRPTNRSRSTHGPSPALPRSGTGVRMDKRVWKSVPAYLAGYLSPSRLQPYPGFPSHAVPPELAAVHSHRSRTAQTFALKRLRERVPRLECAVIVCATVASPGQPFVPPPEVCWFVKKPRLPADLCRSIPPAKTRHHAHVSSKGGKNNRRVQV